MTRISAGFFALLTRFFAGVLCSAACVVAHAQSDAASGYPAKIVRLIVPFPPGGPSDTFARLLGDKLQKSLGQPFVVENRPGGTGIIGTAFVANAAADGYTLLFASSSSQMISPLLHNPRPYDPVKNFEPISMLLSYPFYLVVNNEAPAHSVAELVALAKSNPGKLNFASVGIGSGNHLVSERFNRRAGIDTAHIPYKGVSAMQVAIMSGEVHYMFDSIGPSKPLVDAGKMRALAVTGQERSPLVPHLPTLEESGYPGFDAVIWFGVFAPAGTPQPIVKKLEDAVIAFVRTPEISRRIRDFAATPIGSTAKEFAERIVLEQSAWADIVKSNNIRLGD